VGGTDAAASAAIPAQVVPALVGLGWSERVAAEAVDTVAADAGESDRSSVPALLRLTLSALGPARKETVSG
jgi:Holliday junction DNA helicase RuvA